MSVTGFNHRRRLEAAKAKPGPASPAPTQDEQPDRRTQLMDAIEAATGKRPGVNTKDETLEKRYAELSEE